MRPRLSVHTKSQIGKSVLCLLLWKFVLRLSKHRTTTRIKSYQTSQTQNSASEVDPHSRMQNTSKPGAYSHSIRWGMCRCWGKVAQNLLTSHRIHPPGLKNEDKYRIPYTVYRISDSVDDLGFEYINHMTSTSLAKNVKIWLVPTLE